jgi:hypothetical protein
MKRRTYIYIAALLLAVGLSGYFVRQQSIAARRLAAWSDQRRDAEILVSLDRPIELDTVEPTPLEKFAERFAEQTGFEVVIDNDALQLAGITSPILVDASSAARRLPAAAQLTLALAEHELCWTVRGGQVVITTPEKLNAEPLVVATYPLPQPEMAEQGVDSQAWADAITSIIEPSDWDDVGGAGHCAAVPGALIVVHRHNIHRQIHSLFEHLRAAGDPPASWQPVPLDPELVREANATATARLQRPASIDCREMPLNRLMEFLAAEHDVPLIISKKKLQEASVTPEMPITKTLREMELASLLQHVLRDFELTYTVRDGAVIITTPEDAESQLNFVAYPVHDLIIPSGYQKLGPKYRDYDALIELITTTIKPDSWDDVGGPGGINSVGGWLLVGQTHEVHEQIEALLSNIRRTLALGEPTPFFTDKARHERERNLLAKLDQPIELSYVETPLVACVADISSQLGTLIVIARKRLEEASINQDTPITGEFPRAPAHTQLRRLLEPLELTYTILGEVVVATTPEDAESNLTTRVYDVRSLLDNDVGLFRTNSPTQDIDGLIELVTNQIRPDTWDDVGGPGSIEIYRGLAVVSQTQEVHEELARFLAELRRAMLWRDQPQVMPPTQLTAAEKALHFALDYEITLDYHETPLREVARDISRQIGAPVRFHDKNLKEAGISGNRPITGQFPAASARVQLARLLDPLDLTFDIRDDWIIVTTPEDLDAHLQTQIYDVRSLVFPAGKLTSDHTDDDTLNVLITRHIKPDSWNDVGGPGTIDGVRGVLVVSQTDEVHRELAALLDALRRIRSSAPGGEPDVPSAIWTIADPVANRIYERLGQPIGFVLPEARLDQALEQIAHRTGLPIRRGQLYLEDPFGAIPVTFSINDAQLTLAGVLDRLNGNGYAIANGELLVSHYEHWKGYPRLRLYRVDDFVASRNQTIDQLLEKILAEVAPDKWEDASGPWSISTVDNKWLLVTADTVTHQQLDDWLAEQRTGQKTQRALERMKREASSDGAGGAVTGPAPVAPR